MKREKELDECAPHGPYLKFQDSFFLALSCDVKPCEGPILIAVILLQTVLEWVSTLGRTTS